MSMLRVGVRYGLNLMSMVAEQEGYAAAASAGVRFVSTEVSKLPRATGLALKKYIGHVERVRHPTMYSTAILEALQGLDVEMRPYQVDVDAFWAHARAHGYPRNYAAGTMSEGGAREQKLLEYFVSLDLLDIAPSHVVVDVASEYSIFPEVVRQLTDASVYRQDLIYPPGMQGDRIGGNAAHMDMPDQFADRLVLHNAFEHFEGSADTGFVREAWRVLKPGGLVCIVPLCVSDEYAIATDPLVDRRGVVWDTGARVLELPWWHNRFGRFYDAQALERRIVEPSRAAGFEPVIYHVENVKAVHRAVYLHFGLVLRKR